LGAAAVDVGGGVKPGVVGYSALMEQDEARTFDRLRAHRKEFFDPEIERHHGRPSAMPMSQTMSGSTFA